MKYLPLINLVILVVLGGLLIYNWRQIGKLRAAHASLIAQQAVIIQRQRATIDHLLARNLELENELKDFDAL